MTLQFIQTTVELTNDIGGFLESEGEQMIFHNNFGN